MESPKRGCDLGPYVVKRWRSKNALRPFFLRFKGFPRCQGLRLGRLHSKNAAFCVCVSKPAKFRPQQRKHPFVRYSNFQGRILAERIFRGFLFLGRRIFSRILSPDFFSSFLWEKVPRKILQENPRQNPPKFIQQKSPTHFCRGARPITFALSQIVQDKRPKNGRNCHIT